MNSTAADPVLDRLRIWYTPGRVKFLMRSRGYLVENQWPPDDAKVSDRLNRHFNPHRVTPTDVLADLDRALDALTGDHWRAAWAFVADCGGGGPFADQWQARQERRNRRALPDPRGLGSVKGCAFLLRRNETAVRSELTEAVELMARYLGWEPPPPENPMSRDC